MSQREAVENAVLRVTGTYTDQLSDSQRTEVLDILQRGIRSGDIVISDDKRAKYTTEEGSLKYAKNILSNYLRRSPLLTGGNIKQPKQRRSSTLMMLKKILSTRGDSMTFDERNALESEISSLEKKPSDKEDALDTSGLPANIKAMLGV